MVEDSVVIDRIDVAVVAIPQMEVIAEIEDSAAGCGGGQKHGLHARVVAVRSRNAGKARRRAIDQAA